MKMKDVLKTKKEIVIKESVIKTNKTGEISFDDVYTSIGKAQDYIEEVLIKGDVIPKYISKLQAARNMLVKADDFLSDFNEKHGVVRLKK